MESKNKVKIKKQRIKKFIKEIKRVRWPSAKLGWKTFWITIVFIVIFSLFLFGLAFGLESLWNKVGLGLGV